MRSSKRFGAATRLRAEAPSPSSAPREQRLPVTQAEPLQKRTTVRAQWLEQCGHTLLDSRVYQGPCARGATPVSRVPSSRASMPTKGVSHLPEMAASRPILDSTCSRVSRAAPRAPMSSG